MTISISGQVVQESDHIGIYGLTVVLELADDQVSQRRVGHFTRHDGSFQIALAKRSFDTECLPNLTARIHCEDMMGQSLYSSDWFSLLDQHQQALEIKLSERQLEQAEIPTPIHTDRIFAAPVLETIESALTITAAAMPLSDSVSMAALQKCLIPPVGNMDINVIDSLAFGTNRCLRSSPPLF